MPRVKICGNVRPEDAKKAKELGADFLGIVFAKSKRQLSIEQAKEILDAVSPFDNVVGVFAGQPKDEVDSIAKKLNLKWLQFHGDETSLYCKHFTDQGLNVIKTFRIKDPLSLKRIDEYDVSAFCFDTYSRKLMGGSGITFDWSMIEDKPYVHEKLFLSGGLNPQNLLKAMERVDPFAVDVSSGVEVEPGKKDHALLEQFIRLAKGQHTQKSAPES